MVFKGFNLFTIVAYIIFRYFSLKYWSPVYFICNMGIQLEKMTNFNWICIFCHKSNSKQCSVHLIFMICGLKQWPRVSSYWRVFSTITGIKMVNAHQKKTFALHSYLLNLIKLKISIYHIIIWSIYHIIIWSIYWWTLIYNLVLCLNVYVI